MFIFLTILVLLVFISLLVVCLIKDDDLLHNKFSNSLSSLLPGLNCYQCGYGGCDSYIKALCTRQEIHTDRCVHQNIFEQQRLITALRSKGYPTQGFDNKGQIIAQVFCGGDSTQQKQEFQFKGLPRCEALHKLSLSTSPCTQGCLGLGDCLTVCPERAISLTPNGLAQIDKNRCTGCGLCLECCPTKVIKLLPSLANYYVACNASLTYNQQHNSCKKRCTGCADCVKVAPSSGFILKENLCQMQYNPTDKTDGQWQAAKHCPNGTIIPVGENGVALTLQEKGDD